MSPSPPDDGAVPLESVLCTEELAQRASRAPDYQVENQALTELAAALADSPRTILQRLVEIALKLCRADSAGISLLSREDGGRSFVWPAVSGALRQYVGQGTPRDFGPCGVVLDRDSIQLFRQPQRHYSYLASIVPAVEEALLAPLYVEGTAVGTLWLVSHDPRRRFDAEDVRLITSLGKCAAGAHQVLRSLDALEHEGEVLRESEQRFRTLADTAPAMLWVTEPDASCTFISRGWSEYTGQTPQEASGFGWLEVVHPDDRAAARRTFLEANRRREPFSLDHRIRHADGTWRWVIDAGRPRFGSAGEFLGYVGVVIDVHERKQAEDVSGKRAAQLRLLADVLPHINAATDAASVMEILTEEARTLIDAHQAVASMTIGADWTHAINAVSLSDKYAAWRGYETRPDGSGIYALVCASNRPMRMTQPELEAHPAWKDFGGEAGRHPPLRGWLAAPLVARDGRNLGLIQLSDKDEGDFTADDEYVLVQLAQIASVCLENTGLLQHLREADVRKNEFLATLAHELRSPLAPIRNAVQILRLTGGDGESVALASEMLERQVGQLVHLVDDLLDVNRISRGKIGLRKERVELAAIVRDAAETAGPLFASMHQELSVTLPEEPIHLDADPIRLAQVVGNLLSNAAKFSEPGGATELSVDVENAEHPQVILRVRDHGIGIAAHQLPRIFELFTQLDTSLERTRGGLGIGLALVKSLVEMHGGAVEVHSAGLGQGSEFAVRLPLPSASDQAPLEPVPRDPVAPASRRVLVVDDNRDAATSLAMLLQLAGHTTHTAYDGEEAVAAVRTFRPHVVLLDIGMPRLNGYEACRRIRRQAGGQDVMLVALTGWGQEEDRQRSREAGFDRHLVKPVRLESLTELFATGGRSP
jgi:PAS domain S-box-containing protein